MKNLKRFENFEEKLYKIVDESVFDYTSLDIPEKDRVKLMKFLNTTKLSCDFDDHITSALVISGYKNYHGFTMYIFTSSDEWFYVVSASPRSYYKCDTVDGLIQLIKDNLPDELFKKDI